MMSRTMATITPFATISSCCRLLANPQRTKGGLDHHDKKLLAEMRPGRSRQSGTVGFAGELRVRGPAGTSLGGRGKSENAAGSAMRNHGGRSHAKAASQRDGLPLP